MTEPKYITAAGLRVRVDDATEPLTLDRLDELAALGAELRMKRLREWMALRPWIRDGEG